MAGNVESRIMTMKFDNRQFEQGAQQTLSTLARLKASLNFGSVVSGTVRGLGTITNAMSKIGLKTPFAPLINGANKGLDLIGGTLDRLGMKNPFTGGIRSAGELQRAAQAAGGPAGMGVLEGGVTAVSARFVALSTIAITTLSNITNRAINAGTAFGKSFTVGPVLDGLHEYETNLKSIQTVQANTDQPLDKINASLDELNKYSDQTIYNFSEMARNVGTFTAAGVDLETSVASIKGIANLAALSGSSSEQAAGAMYQLSQAIASGKVGLMDWNSVVNAGMGGKKLQNALAQTAVAMGKIDAAQVKGTKSGEKLTIAGQSFRESIMAKPGQESWLESDILVNTLAAMDGRFSEAALKAELTETGIRKYSDAQVQAAIATNRTAMEQKNGVKYTDEQFRALQKMSTAAFKSATEVKTLGQVFDVAKETIASGWSASFRNVFGDLKQAKALFTGMSRGLNDMINANALARNNILASWAEGGGRVMLIEGLKNAWKALLGLLGPIKEGFRDIFPAKTSEDLISMSKAFMNFTRNLIPGEKTMENIREIARGFFAIFGIGKIVIAGIITGLKAMFGAVGGGEGNFLDFISNIANLITRFHEFLQSSGLVEAFFTGLGKLLSVPLNLLKGIGTIFSSIFDSFDAGKASAVGDAVGKVGDRLGSLSSVSGKLESFFNTLGGFFAGIGSKIANALSGIGDLIADAFSSDNFGRALDVINTTLLGGILLLIRNFFKQGVSIDLTGGLFDGIKETLGEATSALTNMQQSLKADMLLKIAVAIGVLALSLLVLSGIDPKALAKALGAMTVGFGILIGALTSLFKFLGPVGLAQMYVVTSAMTKMALSILLMAFALKVLSSLSFGEMVRGLVTLSVAMKILTKALVPLAAGAPGMAKASFALILVSGALILLGVALKIFATMSWEEMAKGLITLAGALAIMTVAFKRLPALQAEALGLVALGASMILLGVALKIFASMSMEEMAKSLGTLAASLLIIGAAIDGMPKTMLLQATALVVVAGAFVILAGALAALGAMSWESLAKGLITLGLSLHIIASALRLMGPQGAIGAVGILLVATALAVLLPVIVALGSMDIASLLTALAGLAGVFAILGFSAAILAPLTPVLLGLSVALLLIGAGLALAGSGALAAATAFAIVVGAGAAGIAILVQLLGAIVSAIPPALAAFAAGLVQFAQKIGENAAVFAVAAARLINAFLDQIIKILPKIGKVMLQLVNLAINVVMRSVPRLANAGLRMIIGLISAAAANIGRIVNVATSLVVNFLNALSRNMPRIIQAGVRLVISFVNGVANGIRNNKDEMAAAGRNLASALIDAVVSGIRGGAKLIAGAARDAAKAAFNSAKDFLGIGGPSKLFRKEVGNRIPEGMAGGIHDGQRMVVGEIHDLGTVARRKMVDILAGVEEAFVLDPNLNPVITPVLDLSALSQEANRMSSILATAPIMPTVSYQSAADISALTAASAEAGDFNGGGGGDTYVELNQHLHSPQPIDSVASYRGGKTLIAQAKEAIK